VKITALALRGGVENGESAETADRRTATEQRRESRGSNTFERSGLWFFPSVPYCERFEPVACDRVIRRDLERCGRDQADGRGEGNKRASRPLRRAVTRDCE
jgi:hypothetical protein